MFPVVSPSKEENLKQKQPKWEDRFNIKSTIPEYSPLKDKHTISYRKLLQTHGSKQKPESLTQRENPHQKTYFEKKVQLFQSLKSEHPVYLSHLQQFQDFLTASKLPNFYLYYSILPLMSQIDVNGFILKTKKQIKQQTSAYHRISAAIKARQKCLTQMKDLLSKLPKDFISFPQKSQSVKDTIKNYRQLTANTVDEIKKWRDSLKLKQQRPIYYEENNNENYLIKLLNDNQFVFNSILQEYINFGQRNDPFIIVPLKKSIEKEASQFISLIETNKNLAYYQKYMQYLASEKAYVMSLTPQIITKRQIKYPQIQKIYTKSKSTAKFQKRSASIEDIQETNNDLDNKQKQRQREQRLRKNQQRINAIKSVYQSFSAKIKLKQIKREAKKAQTDVQEKTKKDQNYHSTSRTKKNRHQQDEQFDKMVRNRLQKQKNKKYTIQQQKLPIQISVSTRSLPKPVVKSQDKMIQNLKQIQQTLKSKLNFINEETRKQNQSSSVLDKDKQPRLMSSNIQSLNKPTRQSMISELKSQIIKNLEIQSQQRQMQRQRRRQQEQKAIEEIKMKMKKEMEEKLQQRKRQKLQQRQQLQKKLKEQEQRLNKQRQLQVQLQLKLAKQKQLRQLQKMRRQSLQKEMRYKQQLQKQQKLRRQKQQTIQRQRQQKDKLLQQLRKKQLKQQLQKEIKQEMRLRYGHNQKLYPQQDMNAMKQQKQLSLAKQIQSIKKNSNQQLEYIQKQNQLRARTLKLKQQQEQLKSKQLQQLMKTILQKQKQDIQKQAIKKRLQLQQDIKNQAKTKLLQQLQLQKQKLIQNQQKQIQNKLQEQLYRQQIKQKLQRQMRIQAIQKTQMQIEQREQRRYELNHKLKQQKTKLTQTLIINNPDIDKNKIESQVKNQLISQMIFDKQAQKQKAKNDLRLQFQRQLLGSNLKDSPNNATSSIVRKNIQKLKGDEFLDRRMEQLVGQGVVKPTNQKPQDLFNTNLSHSQSPQRKMSRNQSIINSISNQQKLMYDKKRIRLVDMIAQPSYRLPSKMTEQQEGFQLLKVQKVDKAEDSDIASVKNVRKNSNKQTQLQQRQYSKKKKPAKTIKQQPDSQEEQYYKQKQKSKIKNSPSKIQKKKKYQSQQEDSQQNFKFSQNKLKNKAARDSDQALSSQQEQKRALQQSRRSSLKKQQSIRSKGQGMKRNETNLGIQSNKKGYNEVDRLRQSDIRKSNASEESMLRQSPTKVYYDAQLGGTKQSLPLRTSLNPNQRSLRPIAQSKYTIKLEAIQQQQLDEYLGGHFEQLPQIQRQIQLIDRESLYRKLIHELTFCLLLGYENDILVGMAMCVHDRTKTDTRKFSLVHFSTYHNEDLKQFLLSCINYIFRKDPADQIEFYLKFDESQPEQLAYSQQFNKWFDNYGNVYQKKISDNVYERKYVTKRQFNQKCEVILQGVNKNSFRNLFTVYSGVLMCDSDMIQLKEQLKDIISPESQLSYAVAMAELFRTYLTPDQAQILKSKVKQFAKLKQLLVLVVMLQKKKVKLQQMKLSQYKSLIQLNMRLMSQGRQVIRYCKDPGIEHNRIFYAQLSQAFNLPFNFQTTSLPIQSNSKIHHISYFRLSPLPPNKLHIIKSSLYNSQMHILPTQSSKYKIFVLNGQQYSQIRQKMQLDVFMYVRLFLKNVKSHNVAEWKYVWLPQISESANYSVRQFKSFLNKDIYCHDNVNISYKQFLPNALIIEPQHRDLVITPPFIVGVMSMALEQVTEGSPLYARVVDVGALKAIQVEQINQNQQ